MKVMLVNGSPHPKGCTYTALSHAARELELGGIETEIYWIGNKPISGCIDCGRCSSLHQCVFHDQINAFREKAQDCDGFVFGSPVYYAGMNGSLKSFMDRLFFSDLFGGHRTFAFKPAASVATARRAGTIETLDQINRYFTHSQMPIIGSIYWPLAYGSTPEQIEADKEGVYTMEKLGQNMARFLKQLSIAKEQPIPLSKTNTISDRRQKA